MAASADLPRDRVQREARLRGTRDFAAACAEILNGREVDPPFIHVLAGRSAPWFVNRDDAELDYWQRVWAARGLLWVWDDVALPAVLSALDDDAWRVREMALKVVARHGLDEALDRAVVAQTKDPVARVRAAATRAVMRLTASG